MEIDSTINQSWPTAGDQNRHEGETMAHITERNRHQRWFAVRTWILVLGVFMILGYWKTTTKSENVTGHGCFAHVHNQAVGPGLGLQNWRKHVQLMKAHGMNTFVLYINSPEDLAAQIDIAIEEEMLESNIPIFVLVQSNIAAHERIVPNWEEVVKADTNPIWAPGEFAGHVAVLQKARKIAKYPEQWPELIPYNIDEPGRGKAGDDMTGVQRITAVYNEAGYRCGTCVYGPNVKEAIPFLDVVAVGALIGWDLQGCKRAVEANMEFWIYDPNGHCLKPKMVRWQIGYWTWQVQPRSHLTWLWTSFITGDMADPQPTDRLRAYAQGVADFKMLTEAEKRVNRQLAKFGKDPQGMKASAERLKKLRPEFDWEGRPVKAWHVAAATGKPWDLEPEIDLDEQRQVAEKAIAEI